MKCKDLSEDTSTYHPHRVNLLCKVIGCEVVTKFLGQALLLLLRQQTVLPVASFWLTHDLSHQLRQDTINDVTCITTHIPLHQTA